MLKARQQYGQLLILDRFDVKSWACVCTCGRVCIAHDKELIDGVKTDCGCVWRPPVPGYIGRNQFQYQDKVYTVEQIVNTFNISKSTFTKRIHHGWSVVQAIETPVRHQRRIPRSISC